MIFIKQIEKCLIYSHMNATSQYLPSKNKVLIPSETEELSVPVSSIQGEKNQFIFPNQLYSIPTSRNVTSCHDVHDDSVQIDCCKWSPDPLINGPGRCDCILATILAVISVLLVLIGVLLTILHYIIGIEFYTVNRGRIVGPYSRQKVVEQVEQMTLNYCAKERMAYKQYQAELARS
ncbi:unnamed protein product [Heterobilharzia americana]|nr:unnamed protein product [Heterobilharzia americana]